MVILHNDENLSELFKSFMTHYLNSTSGIYFFVIEHATLLAHTFGIETSVALSG